MFTPHLAAMRFSAWAWSPIEFTCTKPEGRPDGRTMLKFLESVCKVSARALELALIVNSLSLVISTTKFAAPLVTTISAHIIIGALLLVVTTRALWYAADHFKSQKPLPPPPVPHYGEAKREGKPSYAP